MAAVVHIAVVVAVVEGITVMVQKPVMDLSELYLSFRNILPASPFEKGLHGLELLGRLLFFPDFGCRLGWL